MCLTSSSFASTCLNCGGVTWLTLIGEFWLAEKSINHEASSILRVSSRCLSRPSRSLAAASSPADSASLSGAKPTPVAMAVVGMASSPFCTKTWERRQQRAVVSGAELRQCIRTRECSDKRWGRGALEVVTSVLGPGPRRYRTPPTARSCSRSTAPSSWGGGGARDRSVSCAVSCARSAWREPSGEEALKRAASGSGVAGAGCSREVGGSAELHRRYLPVAVRRGQLGHVRDGELEVCWLRGRTVRGG